MLALAGNTSQYITAMRKRTRKYFNIREEIFWNIDYCTNKRNQANRAGTACVKNIFLSAVIHPYTPAIITQLKKKIATYLHRIGSLIHKLHINHAARNPLYNHWLAASVFVFSNKSFGKLLNTFLPLVVRANISSRKT